jgi:CRP-like cAMP-binding protein
MNLKEVQVVVKPYQIICHGGEESNDLFYLKSGKLLICTVSGSKVTGLAHIMPGEFVGELSFFDNQPRASYVIALESSIMTVISQDEIKAQAVPLWYLEQAKNLAKKIRLLDQVVNKSNLRKFQTQQQKPLTIDEQRNILSAIVSQR